MPKAQNLHHSFSSSRNMKRRSIADDNAVPGKTNIEREQEEMQNVSNAASLLRNLNDPRNLQSHGMQKRIITSEVSPFQLHQRGINLTLDAFESSAPYTYARAHVVPTAAALTPAPSTIGQLLDAHVQHYRTPSSHSSSAPQVETIYIARHITPSVNANAIHTGTLDTRMPQLVDQTFVNAPSSFSTTETGVNTYPTIGGTRLLPQYYQELAAILPYLSASTQRIVISSLNSSLAQQGAKPLQYHIDLNNLVYNRPTDTARQSSMPPGASLSLLPHYDYHSAPELAGLPQLQTVQSLVYPSSVNLSSPSCLIQHRQDQPSLGTYLNRSDGEAFPPRSLESLIPKTSEDTEPARPSHQRRLNTIAEHESKHRHLHVQNQDLFAPQDHQGSDGGKGSDSPSPSRHQQGQQEDPEKAAEMQNDHKLRVFKSFEERFKDLLAFKERHGHCNVPRRYRLDKSLGVWCNNIRFSYKQINKGRQPHNSLSKDDIRRLEEIGFNWTIIHSKSRSSRDSDESNERSTNVIQKDEDRPSPWGNIGSS